MAEFISCGEVSGRFLVLQIYAELAFRALLAMHLAARATSNAVTTHKLDVVWLRISIDWLTTVAMLSYFDFAQVELSLTQQPVSETAAHCCDTRDKRHEIL